MNVATIAIGIDVATAHLRAVALDPDSGSLLVGPVEVSLPAPMRESGARVSQSPEYAQAARKALSALVDALGKRARGVGAICVTATSGTLVPCDGAGRPLGDALMYNDERATADVSEAVRTLVPDTPHQSVGRLWWLARNTPAVKILSPADVILADLAGGIVLMADNSHHLKSAVNPLNLTWPDQLFSALDIPPSVLPGLANAGSTLGVLASTPASTLGLQPGVALVAGMTDGCTSQISTGAMRPGDTVGVLGTTLVLKAVSSCQVIDTSRGVYSHLSPDGHFLPGGASNVGVGSLRTIEGLHDDEALHRFVDIASRAEPAGIAHYPLVGVGERFPFSNKEATALSSAVATSPANRVRAVIEGVCFVERLGLDILGQLGAPSLRHHVSGGASKSRGWNKLRATILGREIFLPAHTDSAIGAALIACATANGESLHDISQALLPTRRTIEPDTKLVQRLDANYREFLSLLHSAGYVKAQPGDNLT